MIRSKRFELGIPSALNRVQWHRKHIPNLHFSNGSSDLDGWKSRVDGCQCEKKI